MMISCYADDTAILLHSDNYNDFYKKANTILHCVKIWLDNHNMLMLNLILLNLNMLCFLKSKNSL